MGRMARGAPARVACRLFTTWWGSAGVRALGLSACALTACAAEAETPALRPEFLSLCDAPLAVTAGLEECPNRVRHRTGPVQCPKPTGLREHYLINVYQGQVSNGREPQCMLDSSCTEAAHGFCATFSNDRSIVMQCKYGCSSDDDCEPGQACSCGEAFGECVSANCRSDASCSAGYACTSWADGCNARGFACETAEDECFSPADCAEGFACTWDGTRRVCSPRPECG